jgi:hypothetical protein
LSTDTLIKPDTVRYWALSDNFGIHRVEAEEVIQPNGKMVVRNKQQYDRYYIQFRNNQFNAVAGQDVLPTGPNGEDEDVIAYLERQPSFGVHFHRVDEGAPDAGPVHEQITELSVAGSLEGLVELGRVEQANWRRPEVGHALVRALGAMYRATEDEGRQKEIDDAYNQLLELGVEPPPEEG